MLRSVALLDIKLLGLGPIGHSPFAPKGTPIGPRMLPGGDRVLNNPGRVRLMPQNSATREP